MRIGTVKFFLEDKGYGFIDPDGGGVNVFVHGDELERCGVTIERGDRVRFETERAAGGRLRAINVAPILD